jgi:hypothetical protein
MNKDKEWLKEQIERLSYMPKGLDENSLIISKNWVLNFIDQLEEPEVLSQEWIDENKVARIDNLRKMTTSDVVTVEKLKNLLVPKQDKQGVQENFYTFDNAKKWLQDNGFVVFEKDKLDEEVQRMVDEAYDATNEKPVIPQFVVDYYNDYKYYELTFEEWFECSEFGKGGKTENKMFEWLLDNSHEVNIERQFIFADIIAHGLDGYEVEREKKKKYYIYDKSTKGYLGYNADKTRLSWYTSQFPNDVFTEQEIKAIDERYWAFAEEVKPCN